MSAPAQGEPRLLAAAPDLVERLAAVDPAGAPIAKRGPATAADEAEEAALAVLHTLPGGGLISIEPTRALTAVDVDIADRRGGRRAATGAARPTWPPSPRRRGCCASRRLGGAIVIDLVGKGHDGPAMAAAAKAAFAPDDPGVSIGPISRFGLFELAVPHRLAPVASRLLDADGAPTALTVAHRLARAVERQARVEPGDRIEARCAPDVALIFAPHMKALTSDDRRAYLGFRRPRLAPFRVQCRRQMTAGCPICQKPVDAKYRPFCSKRCADVDLQRWFTDGYAIPVLEQEPDEASAKGDDDF